MKRKLWSCFAAALTIFAGSSYLATTAEAALHAEAATVAECNDTDEAYAQGYATGWCQGRGYSGGYLTSCDSGSRTFRFACQ